MRHHPHDSENLPWQKEIIWVDFFFFFLGLPPQHMDVPGLGAELEQ